MLTIIKTYNENVKKKKKKKKKQIFYGYKSNQFNLKAYGKTLN